MFHAHDIWLDHPVALKLIRSDLGSRETFSRILSEARRLARVRHPNVVSVHGADVHDGRMGFWMDLVEGDTLAALVVDGRLSPAEASHIGREVCLALAAVHQAGIVHRDVKAQNVMRATDGGRIILMDFGAGELIGRPANDARPQGTPLYLAPELLRGAPASIASDIYAVGVLLFHLVSRQFPITASTLSELGRAHADGRQRHLRDVRPDLPDAFVAAVQRALHPDPDRRFQSAGELYEALGGHAKEHNAPTTLRDRVVRVATVAATIAVTVELIGLFESRVFEAVLRIDSELLRWPIRGLFGRARRLDSLRCGVDHRRGRVRGAGGAQRGRHSACHSNRSTTGALYTGVRPGYWWQGFSSPLELAGWSFSTGPFTTSTTRSWHWHSTTGPTCSTCRFSAQQGAASTASIRKAPLL